MLIGDYLKKERKIRKITIIELAELSGVSRSYISQIERNESCPFDSIQRMLQALGLSVTSANEAGVNWWASPSSPASGEDLDFLISWLKSQDNELLHKLRVIVTELSGYKED